MPLPIGGMRVRDHVTVVLSIQQTIPLESLLNCSMARPATSFLLRL